MLDTLQIRNFKSIKELTLTCKKINVFIGEPNSGKSNITEALALLSSHPGYQLRSLVRLRDMTDLFTDNQTSNEITVTAGINNLKISFQHSNSTFLFSITRNGVKLSNFASDISGNVEIPLETNIKYYKYKSDAALNYPMPGRLRSPYGDNLVSIILSNQEFKKSVSEIFRSKGFRLNLKPVERELLISKEKDDEIYSYPFNNVSETLRRIVFLMACIETNNSSTIVLDEPESQTFPFYTKYFAERIANDESNQYFLTTHNPYLLESVIAKSKPENLNVIITSMKNYDTNIKVLSHTEILELMNMDAFFNLGRFI